MKNLLVVAIIGSLALSGCASVPYHPYCPDKNCSKKPMVAVAPVTPPPAIVTTMAHTVLASQPITISGINFEFNKAKLLPSDITVVDEVASFAKKNKSAVLRINGYCSKVGSYQYNQVLSVKRALAVKKYLESKGIDGSRMIVIGHSYNDNVATNATRRGRFENQRVEITSTIEVKKG